MRKRHLAFAALAVLMLGALSCNDAPEEGRATVVVTNINNGSPIESDVIEGTLVFEDLIPVTFESRPYNDFITAPRGNVIIESYTVSWVRTDGGSGALDSHSEDTSILVPLGDPASGVIRLVTWEDKSGPILSPLVGTNTLITMMATVEFTAREVGTEHEVKFSVSSSVHFADTQ